MLNIILKSTRKYHLPKYRRSFRSFRFADETFNSLGTVTLYLDTPHGIDPIPVEVDIVMVDIPLLLGLDVLDREVLTPDVAFNLLAKRIRVDNGKDFKPLYLEEWSIPMWRSDSRHSYVPLDVSIATYLTRTELYKSQKSFTTCSSAQDPKTKRLKPRRYWMT